MRWKALEQVKKLLETKWAGIACVFIAILNKCIVSFFSSSLRGDKSLYLLFAQSFLHTGKLAEPINIAYAFTNQKPALSWMNKGDVFLLPPTKKIQCIYSGLLQRICG
jgi:hypothetical protein